MKLLYSSFNLYPDPSPEIIDVPCNNYTEDELFIMINSVYDDIMKKDKYNLKSYNYSDIDWTLVKLCPEQWAGYDYEKYKFNIMSGWDYMYVESIMQISFRLLSDEEYAEYLLE